ncbi:alpha/beta hydrolase [Paenibacillus rhizovicinus]|uniref:Alpha/beta hydrolase n=1 Tax=Paenibacillus rhizovicinus TaxID=2704463 RepID=A0A6C0P7C2_9BACL|nr:alpha/beta hydrolase [Paenibacillus rhizovicinus]QHW34286.1 alpha/beta hydrolase [Paenibacillus rhizovicinus]
MSCRDKETRTYKQLSQGAIQADIYYEGSGSPVIVYIHGGALIFGTRAWLPAEQIERYTSAGFSVVNIDYRLAPETKLQDIVQDIQDALAWVRTTALQWYDFDVERLAVIGSSAGGYLSLLSGTWTSKPKAIVSFYGYGDIKGDWYTRPSAFYCSRPTVSRDEAFSHTGDRELTDGPFDRFPFYLYCRQQGTWVREVSGMDPLLRGHAVSAFNPVELITPAYPPALLLHGDQDTDVPCEQSVQMYERLLVKGIPAKLVTIEGAEHAFDNQFDQPVVQQAFDAVIDFLKLHLQSEA